VLVAVQVTAGVGVNADDTWRRKESEGHDRDDSDRFATASA